MLTDIYVVAAGRSLEVARRFADQWLGQFKESAVEYEFPQYSENPESVYNSPFALIEKLVDHPKEPHAIYWENTGPDHIRNAMLFFSVDGLMIAGLTVRTREPHRLAYYLQALGESVGGQDGYYTFEEPPPEDAEEFQDAVNRSPVPRLRAGSIEM